MIGPRIDQFNGFPFSFFTGFLGEHTNVAEGNVSVAGSARTVALHRFVGKGLDAQGGHLGQRHIGRDHPAVVPGVFSGKEEGAVLLGSEGGAVEGFGLSSVKGRPNRGIGFFAGGIV